MKQLAIRPDPDDARLSVELEGIDQDGKPVATPVVTERPLTLYLNSREVVTLMTIGDHPELLALGYLVNQGMLRPDDEVTAIEHAEDVDTIVVRTALQTDYEEKLSRRTMTSGCAQGTMFGDQLDELGAIRLNPKARLRTSWLYALSRKINLTPSLYLRTGAIHGCVLCRRDRPLAYMEDVGRHNAVDKIAGLMLREGVKPGDKIFYTTGRLTSEMVIKTVRMGIPILLSRSGFTAMGVEIARRAGLTLVGRMRGKRFIALSGLERIVFDADPAIVAEEKAGLRRKGAPSEIE